MKKYDIAAYIWPAYSNSEPRTRIFWTEGNGEWETVKDAKRLFDGHNWPRKPLWGYVNEADSKVMEMEIDQAVSHGVNVFIYDWYWYDNRPFLEGCLDNGFLQARNHNQMKFYLMWANHDVTYGWDRRIANKDYDTIVWQGSANQQQFRTIGQRLVDKYFALDCYYKIDGKAVFSIYDVNNFVRGLGGFEQAKQGMLWLDNLAKSKGLQGVHYQLVKWSGVEVENLSGFDGSEKTISPEKVVQLLPFSSVTHYQYCHICNMGRNYADIVKDFEKEYFDLETNYNIPYAPHVSIGWDNTPRYGTDAVRNVCRNNTPAEFEKALRLAKSHADQNGTNLITINSWNEWTETSYLQPDDLYGYGYLDAVKKVFGE